MSTGASLLVPGRMTREQFRAWLGSMPTGRYERIDGEVVAMAPERASHADRKAMVWLALRRAIIRAGPRCHAYPDGMNVEVDDSDYEPDAIVRCGEPLPGDAIVVPDPLVVAEVLSPSTRDNDLIGKLVAYFRIPTVHHYLIFFADRPQVIHHRRREDSDGIATRIVTSGEIRLDPPGLAITVEEIYEIEEGAGLSA